MFIHDNTIYGPHNTHKWPGNLGSGLPNSSTLIDTSLPQKKFKPSYYDDGGRKQKISELESLTRMYKDLKAVDGPQELLQPIADTIQRYVAEIFYLEQNQ